MYMALVYCTVYCVQCAVYCYIYIVHADMFPICYLRLIKGNCTFHAICCIQYFVTARERLECAEIPGKVTLVLIHILNVSDRFHN